MSYFGFVLGVMAAYYWGEWWLTPVIYFAFCFIDGLMSGSSAQNANNTHQQDNQQENEQWNATEPVMETDSSYAMLGIDESSSDAEVRQAYRKMAKLYHPDLHDGNDKYWATERFRMATDAYENIKKVRKMA